MSTTLRAFERAQLIATDTARKLGRLTGLLIDLGRPAEAVPLLRRALAAAENGEQVDAQLPDVHPGSLTVSSCHSRPLFTASTKAVADGMSLVPQGGVDGGLQVAAAAAHLAAALQAAGKPEEARRLLERSLQIRMVRFHARCCTKR